MVYSQTVSTILLPIDLRKSPKRKSPELMLQMNGRIGRSFQSTMLLFQKKKRENMLIL